MYARLVRSQVGDAGFAALVKHCAKLRSLELEGCSLVTDAALGALRCGTDADAAFVALASVPCPELKSLDLDGTSATKAGVDALGKWRREARAVIRITRSRV